ncbi:MAG: DUF3288 family protein [Cyanobacteria bacterium]|nr:DUF3288 family protein [Cyanobacteriota bacterium]MDW8202925.1 DUF3288 family protein [Cyanobacteriota bacterium SKYGB_h_bin112]
MAASEQRDQQHPQAAVDRQIVNALLAGEPTDYNLAELGRLRIRYRGFPGARDIQADLEKVLRQWGLTEEALYEKTRRIHAEQIYRDVRGRRNDEDWS